MPKIGVDGAVLWYDRRGSGHPVLMVTGLGGNHTQWNYLVKDLSQTHECIVMDNRGTGESSVEKDWLDEEHYTLGRLADDLLAILDTLDIAKAHLVGISMGGVVAQLFALRYPGRLKSLSLHSTWCRGRTLSKVRIETWLHMLQGMEMKDFLLHLAPWIWSNYSLETKSDRINRFRVAQRERGGAVSKEVYILQCRASMALASVEGIETINLPTLITAGADDILVPALESQAIHTAISGSIFHEFEGCGHASLIEDYESFNRVQIDFLDEVDRG